MVLASVYKSIVRNTVDLIAEINSTIPGAEVEYMDWESRYDENALPHTTLLGVDGWTWEERQGLWVTRYGLGLSSYADSNLLNEIDIVDLIHQWTGEGKKVNLLNPDDGELITELVTSAWQLSPMAQSQYRNYRTISIELLRTAETY